MHETRHQNGEPAVLKIKLFGFWGQNMIFCKPYLTPKIHLLMSLP
jgi:hypothetical protein